MNIISAKYLYNLEGTKKTHIVVQLENNVFKNIPIKESNIDYQYMLEWVAEGNTITDNGGGE